MIARSTTMSAPTRRRMQFERVATARAMPM